MTDIKHNLELIHRRIRHACAAAGRPEDAVHLLAVSKTKPLALVEQAVAAGQQDFGENYLQDALEKVNGAPTASWHFIGAIQSNKTRDIATHFNWVHSVASQKVARRLSEQRPRHLPPLNVLFQVNIDDDNAKAGVAPEDLAPLVAFAATCENLRPVGLMAIPRPEPDAARQREPFRALRELLALTAQTTGVPMTELSMGMSRDLEAAIMEGATWIRVGTDIFGARD